MLVKDSIKKIDSATTPIQSQIDHRDLQIDVGRKLMAQKQDMIARVMASQTGIPQPSPRETAAYTAAILKNLKDLAKLNNHRMLAHLLTIAMLEASWQAEQ